MKTICHPFRMIVTIVSALTLFLAALGSLYFDLVWLAVLFVVLAAAYLYVYGYTFESIHADEEGVTVTLLWHHRFVSWRDIKEFGVLYPTLVVRPRAKKHPSSCCIYLSTQAMANKQRTDMVRMWRPSGIISLGFTPERLQALRQYWRGDVILFLIKKTELFPDGILPAESHKLVERKRS